MSYFDSLLKKRGLEECPLPLWKLKITEEEFKERGVNVVIYANQLMRATVPAIQNAANMILENHRAQECDSILMPFKEIIRMIPEDE